MAGKVLGNYQMVPEACERPGESQFQCLQAIILEASSDTKGEVRLLPVCGGYFYGPQQWDRNCVRWLLLCLSCHQKSVVIFLIKCHYSVAQKWEQ